MSWSKQVSPTSLVLCYPIPFVLSMEGGEVLILLASPHNSLERQGEVRVAPQWLNFDSNNLWNWYRSHIQNGPHIMYQATCINRSEAQTYKWQKNHKGSVQFIWSQATGNLDKFGLHYSHQSAAWQLYAPICVLSCKLCLHELVCKWSWCLPGSSWQKTALMFWMLVLKSSCIICNVCLVLQEGCILMQLTLALLLANMTQPHLLEATRAVGQIPVDMQALHCD